MSVYVGRRDVVSVVGADAATYLQGQISQDVDAIGVGESAWSLVLQPQGRVDALFRLTRARPDHFLLDVETGHGQALVTRLQRFLLRMDVTLEVEAWDWHAHRQLEDQVAPAIDAPIVAEVDWNSRRGIDVIGPQLLPPDVTVPRLTDVDLERLRIEAGVPRMGAEIDQGTIPAEAGNVDAWVSFTKGCYTGQELVARVDSRGNNTPRSLYRIRGEGPAPSPGDGISADGDAVGSLTSVASTPTGWLALGYLKRGTGDAARLTVKDAAVAVESLRRTP